MLEFKKAGKFNTGRLYAANGQEIIWALVEQDGKRFVAFKDHARGITGHILMHFGNSDLVTNDWVLRAYDDFHYKSLDWEIARELTMYHAGH